MEELLNTTVDENQNLQNEKENLENQLKKAKEQTRHLEGELETVPVLREQVCFDQILFDHIFCTTK